MTLRDFSNRDRQKIVKLVRERGRQPIIQRNTLPRRPAESTPAVLVKLPGTLPGATGTTTITAGMLADCVIYTRNTDTHVIEVTEETETVYNLSSTSIPAGLIRAIRIDGDLWAISDAASTGSYPTIITDKGQPDTPLTSTPTGFLGAAVDYNSDTGVFLPLGGTSGISILQNGYYLADVSATFYLTWLDVTTNTETAVDFDQQLPAKVTSTLLYNPIAGWVYDDGQPLFFPTDLMAGGLDEFSEPRQITMHYCEAFEVTGAPQTQNILFSKQTGNVEILNLSWSIQKLS